MKKTLLVMSLLFALGLVFAQTYLIQEGFSTTSLPTGWSGDVYFNSAANIGNLTGANGAGFNLNDKYLQLPSLSNVGTLTFWTKGSAASSQISLKVQKSVGGGAFTDIATFPKPHTTTATQRTVVVNDASTNIVLKFVSYERAGNSLYLDDVQVTAMSATPTIVVNPSTLSNFTYVFQNGPSNEQSFSVTGSNLTANVSVAVTSNYAISSTSGGTFGSSLTLTQSGGNVSATVYVRQVAGLAIGTGYTGTVTCSSTGATNATVSLSGTVTTPPPPTAPTATDATNVANTTLTANWSAVSGATGYYLDVYTGSLSELINTGFEGSTSFPTGWTQNSSYVQSNSSIAHTGSYYSGMNAANDYFYTPQLSSPTTISFWVSASSATANNTTIVQYSTDATTWTDLATYSANGTDTGDVTVAWSQKTINANLTGNYYIRWFMSARSGGSAYFDDVLITSGSTTFVLQNQIVTTGTSYNVTGLTAGTTYYYVVRAYNAYGTSANSNEITATTTSTTPLITVSPTTLTGFTYMEGSGPSAEQSFTISGSNLTANISIAATTNYEISTGTGASFVATNPITLTQSGGSVGNTTIYVRLKAGLTAVDYNNEVITATSTNATPKTVTCSGTVTAIPDPALTVSVSTLSGFNYVEGSGPSDELSFTVSGTYLTGNISLDAPASYEISTGNGLAFDTNMADPLILTAAKLDVATTTIYVRLKAGLAEGVYNGELITITSSEAETKTVTLNGYVQTNDVPFLYWDFNDNPPTSGNWTQPIAANYGTGSLTYTFVNAVSFTGTTINTMIGDLANGGSFVPQSGTDNVNNGEEFVMAVNTTDLENIVLTYATQRTSTGFTSQAIWYSLDGGLNYTLFTTITSIASSWEVKELDFSSVTGANDNASFMVKIVVDGATGTTGTGNNRFDNISFFGDEIVNTPVVLSSFTATFSNQMYVKLTWVTQSETNMTGYYVLRSQNENLVDAQIVSPMIRATNTSSTQTYEFTDTELYETGTYYYWLEMNEQGSITYEGPRPVEYQTNVTPPTIPAVTSLNAIFPNPFNPVAYIPFSISDKGAQNVQILIYNSRGQIVFSDDLGSRAPGNHSDYSWNGKDNAGLDCSTGIYFIRMIAGKDSFLRKAVMVK